MLAIVSTLLTQGKIATRDECHVSAAGLRAHSARRRLTIARIRRHLCRGEDVAGVGAVRRRGEHDAVHTSVAREQRAAGVARAYDGTDRVDLPRDVAVLIDVGTRGVLGA